MRTEDVAGRTVATRGAVQAAVPVLLVAMIVLPGVAACDRSDAVGDAAVVRDSAGVAIVENGSLEAVPACPLSSNPTVSIGSARGEEPYQLYRVFGARRLSDGQIAVVNQGSQELRLYDREGSFLHGSGREGEGPGEFRDAFQLWVLPGDTILVGDYRPWRFLVFGPGGEWVRDVTPEPLYPNPPDAAVLDDGRSVLGSSERSREGSDFRPEVLHLIVHAPDGTLLDTLGVWPHGSYGQPIPGRGALWVYPWFEAFSRFAAAGESIAVTTAEQPEIRLMDASGGVRRIIRWEGRDRTVNDADVAAARRELRQLLEPLLTEDRPVAEHFPTVAALEFGRDGRLWVRRYPRPEGPKGERWLVFEPEGRPACEVTLPDGFDPYEFGADYVLGTATDELDVERVVMYGLAPPALEAE